MSAERIRAIFGKQEAMEPTEQGRVYILCMEAPGCRVYKIGRSSDANERTTKLRCVAPFPIRLVHEIQTSNPAWLERVLHDLFATKRENGEWFSLADDDVAWICQVQRMDGGALARQPTGHNKGGRKPAWPPRLHVKGGRCYSRVAFGGKTHDVSLGRLGDPETQLRYAEMVAELERNGYRAKVEVRRRSASK